MTKKTDKLKLEYDVLRKDFNILQDDFANSCQRADSFEEQNDNLECLLTDSKKNNNTYLKKLYNTRERERATLIEIIKWQCNPETAEESTMPSEYTNDMNWGNIEDYEEDDFEDIDDYDKKD